MAVVFLVSALCRFPFPFFFFPFLSLSGGLAAGRSFLVAGKKDALLTFADNFMDVMEFVLGLLGVYVRLAYRRKKKATSFRICSCSSSYCFGKLNLKINFMFLSFQRHSRSLLFVTFSSNNDQILLFAICNIGFISVGWIFGSQRFKFQFSFGSAGGSICPTVQIVQVLTCSS